MAIPQLLVHDKKDTVGVVVVEGLKKGTDMLCVVTADNSSFKLKAKMDVPIGHKVALTDIKKGDTIYKYGQDVGVAKTKIGKGEHVHVHNIKTKRWYARVSRLSSRPSEASAGIHNPGGHLERFVVMDSGTRAPRSAGMTETG
jgi:(2R)-sulfolactate sulfo-lyase subunit alpha